MIDPAAPWRSGQPLLRWRRQRVVSGDLFALATVAPLAASVARGGVRVPIELRGLVAVVACVAGIGASSAAAQVGDPGEAVVHVDANGGSRVTVIDVGEDVIEGVGPAKPSSSTTVAAPKVKHRSLIRLRTDFRSQVLSSVSQL